VFKAEWKSIFTTKMLFISIVAIMLVPLIYGGTFLWSFWDPYGKLDKVPVAIVNEDKPAEISGKKLNVGEELVDELIKDKSLDFHQVSAREAEKGMDDNKYYLTITIPEDFSKNAGTLLDDHPKHMEIEYRPNKGANFIASQVGSSAVEKIRTEVNAKVAETYSEQVFKSIKKMGKGFGDAADGAGELADGSGDLDKGANDLHDGILSLKDGIIQLSKGAVSAKSGAGDLNDGIISAKDGAIQINDGIGSAKDGSVKLADGISSAKDGSTKLADGAVSAKDGSVKLADGISSAKDGSVKLADGAVSAKDGSVKLADGISSAKDGSVKLADGAVSAKDGSVKLADGNSSAKDG